MVLLNWQWAVVSAAIMATIYFLIYRKQVQSRWGDLSSGYLFERTRTIRRSIIEEGQDDARPDFGRKDH